MSTEDAALMTSLPSHGKIACDACFRGCGTVAFDRTEREEGGWRIRANPLAWGNTEPEIVVLGFSKGPTQAGALATTPHDEIAYRRGRKQVGKILRHLGLLPGVADDDLASVVTGLIADRGGRFHFGSLIRCTVEQHTRHGWRGTGANMLDKFVASPFGQEVASNCSVRFLGRLPPRTRLVLMFGMGTERNYVKQSQALFQRALGGSWRHLNDVAYTNGQVTVVHVEHFKSQGALLGQWLGQNNHPRERWGTMAQDAVRQALETAPSSSRVFKKVASQG